MISPPVQLGGSESFAQAFANFMVGFTGKKPVFSNGVQIGYLKDGNACRGVIELTKGAATNTDPKTWMTKDKWWRDVSVTKLCMDNNITPTWLEDKKDQIVTNPVTGVKTLPGVTDSGTTVVGMNIPLLAAAGVGGIGLLLLLRR